MMACRWNRKKRLSSSGVKSSKNVSTMRVLIRSWSQEAHTAEGQDIDDPAVRLDRAAYEPSPHGTHGGKTPTGPPAGGQRAALRLQPDCLVAVFGTTLLDPEFASILRDIGRSG
jgi:hypothetical protein